MTYVCIIYAVISHTLDARTILSFQKSDLAEISHNLAVEGFHQKFWSDLQVSNKILLLDKALKLGVIFQIYALKLFDNGTIMEKIEKTANFWANISSDKSAKL